MEIWLQIFKKIDANGDWKLDRAELDRTGIDMDGADKDKNGVISQSEWDEKYCFPDLSCNAGIFGNSGLKKLAVEWAAEEIMKTTWAFELDAANLKAHLASRENLDDIEQLVMAAKIYDNFGLKDCGIGMLTSHYLTGTATRFDHQTMYCLSQMSKEEMERLVTSQPEWADVKDKLPPTGAVEFLSFLYNSGYFASDGKRFGELWGLCKKLNEENGIQLFGRYNEKIFTGIGRENALFVQAYADHNQSFRNPSALETLVDENVKLHPVEGVDEQQIYASTDRVPNGSQDYIIISQHGTETSASYGYTNNDDGKLDRSDTEYYKHVLKKLKPGGTIIFDSCSTGRGEKSLASWVASLCRKHGLHATIYAPDRPIYSKWERDSTGRIVPKYFDAKTGQPIAASVFKS